MIGSEGQAQENGPPVVIEELDWKQRAMDAEARIEELAQRISELEAQLAEARAACEAGVQEDEIAALLAGAEAIDEHAARVLLERVMEESGVSAAEGLRMLRRDKPFLFAPARSGAMGSRLGPADPLDDLARCARASGDRHDLLAYLRRRRAG